MRLLLAPMTVSAAALLSVAPADAQEVVTAAAELPPVLVQGATLEAKRTPVPRAPAADIVDDDSTAGTGRKRKVKAGATGAPVNAEGGEELGSGDVSGGSGGIEADKLGSAVSVLTGAELKARQIRNAAEALRSLPGVEVNKTGGLVGLAQVRIRGADAHHTLVVVDGIVANSGTDGEFDFGDLLAEDIDRIEVIRGPQSALYGSGAMGGVINIVTRGGRGPLTVTTRVEAGSHGTVDAAARVSGGTDRAWGSITVHRQKTDGFNVSPDASLGETDAGRITSLSANGGVRLLPGVELSFTARDSTRTINRDDQTSATPASNRNGLIVSSDSLSVQDAHVMLLGAQLRWDMLGGALTHIFRANHNTTERNDLSLADYGFGITPSRFSNESLVDTLAYQSTYRFATPMLFAARHSLTGLVEHEHQAFTRGPDLGDGLKHERGRTSYAGEWHGELFDRLDLVAGVRHDDSDKLPDYTTWRSSASLRLPELAVRPHASVGTAIKLPSQFEQFGAAANFVANPGLQAEKSFGWDAGVEFTVIKNRATVDVTYFKTDLSEKITNQFAAFGFPFACNPGDFFCSRSINLAGVSRRQGIEVAGRVIVAPGLSVGLAYTWLDAVDGSGLEEARRPPHAARGDLTYAFDNNRGKVTLAAAYNGEMQDIALAWGTFAAVRTTLDDYWLVNATASYKLTPGMEVYGRVENALDSRYEEVFGFNTAGIAAYAGVRFTFEDPNTASWAKYRE
jgi:vitamin B12 transporter